MASCAWRTLHIEIEREEDGRFTAEVMELPGVIVTEATRDEAITAVKALAFRVIADCIQDGEPVPEGLSAIFQVGA